MAKKKVGTINTRNTPASAKQGTPAAAGKPGFISRYQHILIPAAIACITWLCLNTCLNNQLTNWDDPGYVRDNPLIKDISAAGLKNIFSTPVMGNYHPLTILTYAIEYSFVRLDPWLYHLDSLLLHILVTILVYCFVNLLTRRPIAAAVTALLFGLHPMHMESVAWLAGRKDVVYGAFYMAACIAYLYLIRAVGSAKRKWYAAVLLLFICALLAKPIAVTLPLTLLLIDYFEKRKLHYSLLVEKLPHFTLAIIFGIRSIIDQHEFGAIDTQNIAYTFLDRLMLGWYALITYLWKAIAPINLTAFYAYPEKVGGALPAIYFIYPAAAIALLFLVWKFFRSNVVVLFGALFFLVNIALLLQFIPVGAAILADRYTYIPYIGLFFIAGWYVSGYFQPGGKKHLAYPALTVVLAYTLLLGYLSKERCKTWYDTTSLWRDVIEKQPRSYNAYNNLGFSYFNKFNESMDQAEKKRYYDSSVYLLKECITLQPDFKNSYISLGELMRTTGQYAEAKRLYYKALSLTGQGKEGEAYLGLAIIYAITQNFDSSGYCFHEALRIKPVFPEAHSNYGNFFDMTGRRDSALIQYGIAISQNPDMDAFHLNRGRTLTRLNRWDEAMKDFNAAISINPRLGDNYYARSFAYAHNGNKALALNDINTAIKLGFTGVDQNYYQSLQH